MTTFSLPIADRLPALQANTGTWRKAVVLALLQAMWMAAAVNFVAPQFTELLTGDVAYFLGAAKHVLAGDMPYRDFAFEYPPGALLPMVMPAVLAGGAGDATAYLWMLVAQNAVLAGAITLLLARWRGVRAAVLFNLLLAITAAFTPLRFDLLPALLTLLAVKWAIDRPARSGVMLALGVLVKLYPAVLLPILLLPALVKRDWKSAIKMLAGFGGTLLIVLLPVTIVSHGHLFDFVAFHKARGLQIESVAGAAILLASKLHLTTAEVGTSFFSSNVSGPWVALALKAIGPALLMLLAIAFVRGWRLIRTVIIRNHELALVAAMTLCIFIACNKVFSPQYVVWVLPLLAMIEANWIVAAIAMGLTAIVFPFEYDGLKQIAWLPVVLVNARNAILVAAIVYGLVTRPRKRISPVAS